jgi:hypothetical protein
MVTENNEDFSDDHPPDIYSDDGDGSLWNGELQVRTYMSDHPTRLHCKNGFVWLSLSCFEEWTKWFTKWTITRNFHFWPSSFVCGRYQFERRRLAGFLGWDCSCISSSCPATCLKLASRSHFIQLIFSWAWNAASYRPPAHCFALQQSTLFVASLLFVSSLRRTGFFAPPPSKRYVFFSKTCQ